MTGFGSPCGACKFLRRKCVRGCVFAPYFCHEQGAAHFAAIHKVFGASNVSKLLAHLPLADRPEAAVTISYEAQARLRDPIYGCVAHIFALQQQVMTLQAQLASLKAAAAATQGMHHQEDVGATKGGYMSAAEQLGYGGYDQWCGSNGGCGLAGGAPASQPGAYSSNGAAGHDSITALLAAGSDYMQHSLYHAFDHSEGAGAVDDGHAAAAAFEAAAESSSCGMAASFAADESVWRSSSSGYQDCEDLQSVAYAYLNRS
uniref:LOB domain-containing protein n=1 Tax=Oryza punctata TaxID=4537 RepID=A0A0E0K8T8_ORYPU